MSMRISVLTTALMSRNGSVAMRAAARIRMDIRHEIGRRGGTDRVVFDMETITDRATFVEPHQHSEGIDHLLVNGEWAIRLTRTRRGRQAAAARSAPAQEVAPPALRLQPSRPGRCPQCA